MNILGVKISNLSKEDILARIEIFLSEPCFHQIATVNPEFILEAQKNPKFKKVLDEADLNVADGVGIWFAFLRFGRILKARIAGVDLMQEILRIASEKNLKIFLAAKKDGLSTWQETRDAILKIYPGLEIEGENFDLKNQYAISNIQYPIIFCNFGAPYQELFLNSQKNDTIRLAMGVGGSFDFLTGHTRRAPLFIRRIGLEWLWRLILQPKRIGRILKAVIVFPIKIIFEKYYE